MREDKYGWHVISGYPVFVKNGIVSKVLDLEGTKELANYLRRSWSKAEEFSN